MTVCDFVAVQTADILSEFSSSGGEGYDTFRSSVGCRSRAFTCRANALDGAIRNHQNDSARLLLSELCRLKLEILSGEDRLQFIRKCYEMFSGTDYGSSFVADYAHNLVLYPGYEASRENDINARNEIRRRQLAICKEYVAAHQARNIGQVYSVINDLESKRISLDFPEVPFRTCDKGECVRHKYLCALYSCRSMRSYGQQPGREVFTSPFGGRRRILACQSCRTGSRREV